MTCDPTSDCISCVVGKYLKEGACPICDHSVCASCITSDTNCVLACNSDCKLCNTTGMCTACNDGLYLTAGTC